VPGAGESAGAQVSGMDFGGGCTLRFLKV